MSLMCDNLIKEVRKLAEELGRTPKKREFKQHNIAKRIYGSWNNFIKEAGLRPLVEIGLTKEECENYIHDFVRKNNKIPSTKDFDSDIYLPDSTTIIRIFGLKWSEILRELGYNTKIDKYGCLSEKDIYNLIKEELERIGSTKLSDYRDKRKEGLPSYAYIKKRLNKSWNEILEKLNYELNHDIKTKEEYIEILKKAYMEIGKVPSIPDLEKLGIENSVFFYHFGSYNNALLEAGLTPNFKMTTVDNTDEELLEMYKDLCKRLGRAATSTDIESNLPYKKEVFEIRFGGMNELKRLVGYKIKDTHKKYTKEIIIDILKDTYRNNGKLTLKEIGLMSKRNDEFPSLTTILRYFKTTKISEVWEIIEKEELN